MKTHYSVAELLQLDLDELPKTKMGLSDKIKREQWQFREVSGRGGKGGIKKEYVPPPAIAAAILAAQTEKVVAQTVLPALKQPENTEVSTVSGSLKPVLAQETAVSVLNGSTAEQRNRMGARLGVLNAIEQLMTETKVGKDAAITTFLTTAALPHYESVRQMLRLANDKRGGGGDLPSVRTIKRWFAARDKVGEACLMPAIPQKNMQQPEWFALFMQFYGTPQKPSVQAAFELFLRAFSLQQPLAKPPSVHQVRRWLDKTGNVQRHKGRMGARELKSIQGFKRRKWQDLMPLDVVSADGQCFDAECGHPDNPNAPIRPEVTMIVDIGTRKIVGVGVDTAESGRAVRGAMVEMMTRYGIAAIFYADNGKGYTNGLLNDETTGLLGRVGMTMIHSAPYSSQSRGVIERLHQTVLVKAAKRMQSYIGKDMDGEASRLVHKTTRAAMKQEIALREIPALKNIVSFTPRMLPTFEEMKALIYQAVEDYNNTPHSSLERVKDVSGCVRRMTPNELWAIKEAKMNAAGDYLHQVDAQEQMYLFLPQEVRKIQRCEVHFRTNIYHNKAFAEWNGEEVRVAYDEHHAERIWLFDMNGRYLGSMDWNDNQTHYMPKSVVEQAKDKRIDAQVARLGVKQSILESTRAQPKALEHQGSVDLGGFRLDMVNVKAEAEVILAKECDKQSETTKVMTFAPIESVDDTPIWRVPSSVQKRFAEYQRLTALSPDDLTAEQLKFINNPLVQRDVAAILGVQDGEVQQRGVYYKAA